jgi:phosphinothricin acetyltransferase
MILRAATGADASALAEIYGHHVRNGTGTFEEVAPTPADMEVRRATVAALGLPWLVAEADGRVLGYAYAGPYKLRSGYRYTVEDSVYIAPDAVGRGIGKALLAEVLRICEEMGMRQMVAVIGDSGNAASVALHTSLGFHPAGAGRDLGFKFGRFLDIVWMQKPLGGGATRAPDTPGLALEGR